MLLIQHISECVITNEGFQRLPILIKHPDPEIAKFAWILSKYFSKRDEIMPEKIV